MGLEILEYMVYLALAYPILKGLLAIIRKAKEIRQW